MSPEPEKARVSPKSETAASPAPVPSFDGGKASKALPPSGPGEPYTPMPDFARPARPRWLYALAALLLALAAAAGTFFMHERAAAPAAPSAPVEAPVTPGPGAAIK